MVVRSRDGEERSFPVVETIHRNSICYVTEAPADVPDAIMFKAQEVAERAVGCLEGTSPPVCVGLGGFAVTLIAVLRFLLE